ncbi:PP2C family protein-serine/threonine phosphatase [Streptomyces sp. ST2-7A]|uniref:PP2C family protein-serine/threonine phosphatase n=1 Tax=Streptomyces sp. ST2-7A TaxID=2907214 RepID=UPI001F31E5B4|nr:PP2C family protein-serine/threonine phosphatase [Streptomyces sp. ST2-7A]MCE7080907.1 serine/threonine-protein phosphatase [Streptomyces sp. ST2-7A]
MRQARRLQLFPEERRAPAPRYLRLLPVGLVALGTVLNLITPPEATFTPLFAAAPLVAAALLSFRETVIAALVSTVSVVLLTIYVAHAPVFSDEMIRGLTVVTVSAFSLLVSRLNRQLASARGVAAAVQRAVLPAPPGRVGTLEVAARYQAAREDTLVGGDLYAAVETPYGARLLVGDVRGKGIGATEAVTVILGAFREIADTEPDLVRVGNRLESAWRREGGRRVGLDGVEGFTTAIVVEAPADDPGVLRILDFGHPPPVLLTPDGRARYVEVRDPGLPLGLAGLVGSAGGGRVEEHGFPAGSSLVLYTDGVSEARDRGGGFYDPVRALDGRRFSRPRRVLDVLFSDIAAHTDGVVQDDIAVLAVRRPVPGEDRGDGRSGRQGRRGGVSEKGPERSAPWVGVTEGERPAAGDNN